MTSNYVPTCFLSLPNELIYHILKYLSPVDLVVSFGNLPNHRLRELFASCISLLDLNLADETSLMWLNQYRAVVQQYIKRVVTDITLVETVLCVISKLDALNIIFDDDTQHLLYEFVDRYSAMPDVCIGALTLSTYHGRVNTSTANILIGDNGRLPEHTLKVSDCRLELDMHNLPSHCGLRNLDCIVQEETFLYALLVHLPNLEKIKIVFVLNGLEMESDIFANATLLSASSFTDVDSDVDSRIVHLRFKPKENAAKTVIVAPPHLRFVSIVGHIANFDLLSQLFQLATKSLKKIKLKVFAYAIIDPDQMNRIANHIDFDFCIDYQLFQLPIDFDWKSYVNEFKHRPAIRCKDNVFCRLSSVIEKPMFWLQTPKIFVTSPHVLCFPKVRTLKFQYCRFKIDTNTVKLIRETFPSMRTLVWRLPAPRVTSEISLDMVNTIVVHSDDRQTLQGLLLLCPTVTRLYFTRAFKQMENLPELSDKRIQNIPEQIKRVQLIPDEKVKKQSIKKLFPNAEITYDAQPFYEQRY